MCGTHKNGEVFRLAVAFFQYLKPANDLQADQVVNTWHSMADGCSAGCLI